MEMGHRTTAVKDVMLVHWKQKHTIYQIFHYYLNYVNYHLTEAIKLLWDKRFEWIFSAPLTSNLNLNKVKMSVKVRTGPCSYRYYCRACVHNTTSFLSSHISTTEQEKHSITKDTELRPEQSFDPCVLSLNRAVRSLSHNTHTGTSTHSPFIH